MGEPPPLPGSARNLFVGLAAFSWIAVIMTMVLGMVLTASGPSSPPSLKMGLGIVACLFALGGFLSGISALLGIPRFGSRGLLWPALIGMGLWVLLIGLAVPSFLLARSKALMLKPTVLTPLVHSPAATRIEDAELGYSFDLPVGYEAFPDPSKLPGYRKAFIRRVPGEANRVLLVKSLGLALGRRRIKAEDIAAQKTVSLMNFSWRGVGIDGLRVPEKLESRDYLTFNVQIPLRGKGIQMGFGGAATAEPELRALVEQVLSTLDGQSER